jgi:hypothetical protein
MYDKGSGFHSTAFDVRLAAFGGVTLTRVIV